MTIYGQFKRISNDTPVGQSVAWEIPKKFLSFSRDLTFHVQPAERVGNSVY